MNSILSENKTLPKSRQQIYSENYQKNKEIKKAQRRERYAKQKEQEQLSSQKYYQASNIKVLLTLKEYTELNREKQKL
jgi:flagellar motility protein MotE (MotC chaperone)